MWAAIDSLGGSTIPLSEFADGSTKMADEHGQNMKIRIEQHTFMGTVRVVAWMFAIGFVHLDFWRGVLAVLLWPYYLGMLFSALARWADSDLPSADFHRSVRIPSRRQDLNLFACGRFDMVV